MKHRICCVGCGDSKYEQTLCSPCAKKSVEENRKKEEVGKCLDCQTFHENSHTEKKGF
jgi:hypothetical protein